MFRRYNQRRHTNILFVTFRLILSVVMFGLLLGGIYSAYKHFSGLDPVKLDPQAVVLGIADGDIGQIISKIPGLKGKWLASRSKEVGSGKIDNEVRSGNQKISLQNLTSQVSPPTSKPLFKFALIADSHSDNINLKKALLQAKDQNPQFVIGLGDYTDVGTVQELRAAKKEFDSAGIRYFLIPGDHDLWDSRNRSLLANSNFREVFGPSYQSFIYDNFLFILLYNSDNYIGIEQSQVDWLLSELEKAKADQVKAVYIFLHEPVYHPSSDHVMGRVESKLKQQAKSLIRQLLDLGVKQVFFGDIHYFSEYIEPDSHINMVTVGAITSERNAQAPRFAVVTVFEDGTSKVEDVEIK